METVDCLYSQLLLKRMVLNSQVYSNIHFRHFFKSPFDLGTCNNYFHKVETNNDDNMAGI